MLPWDRPRGRKAYKRLKVFIGFPDELKDKPVETMPHARFKPKFKSSYIKLGELAREIGWKVEGR
jgi:large subunit ribosomal protein L13